MHAANGCIVNQDFASYGKEDIHKWATNNEIAKSQADYIAKFFTAEQLLAISERDLLDKHKKLSGVTVGRLLGAIKFIRDQGTNISASNANEEASPKTRTNLSSPEFPYDDDLNTKEGVLNWLNRMVELPPKSLEVSNVSNEVVCKVTKASVDFADHWSQFSPLCLYSNETTNIPSCFGFSWSF